jgi:putative heavy-metal-binding protein
MGTTYSAPGRMVAHNMVTTQFELDGFRVVRTLGVVRGIVVRSRSIFGTIGAGLQTLVGGNITLLTNLCEKTRAEACKESLRFSPMEPRWWWNPSAVDDVGGPPYNNSHNLGPIRRVLGALRRSES